MQICLYVWDSPSFAAVLFVEFFFECYGDHRDLHVLTRSFPTRRSSDLLARRHRTPTCERRRAQPGATLPRGTPARPWPGAPAAALRRRSEEHTSELQSLMRISYAVFCLNKQTCYRLP